MDWPKVCGPNSPVRFILVLLPFMVAVSAPALAGRNGQLGKTWRQDPAKGRQRDLVTGSTAERLTRRKPMSEMMT